MANLNEYLLGRLKSLTGYEIPTQSRIFNSRIDEGFLIISHFDQSGSYKVEFLNKTAGLIFYFCDGNRNINDISDEMSALFKDEDYSTIFESTVKCIRHFEGGGLVTVQKQIQPSTP